ncbi:MAG: hypothetical protein JWM78_1154 [Verrucomicrobiaceae bacterium]|nr:hypothetical protein [Verrucomicrobiaceae bacterium]
MSDSEKPVQSDASDEALSRRIAATLDRSIADIDAPTRARLASIRHDALSTSRNRRALAGFALAASLAAIVATPWLLQRHAQTTAANDVAYLSVDPDMLADMDMLQVVGESE